MANVRKIKYLDISAVNQEIQSSMLTAVESNPDRPIETQYANLVNGKFPVSKITSTVEPATAVLSALVSFKGGGSFWINNLEGVDNSSTTGGKTSLESAIIPFSPNIGGYWNIESSKNSEYPMREFGKAEHASLKAGSGVFNFNFGTASWPTRGNADPFVQHFTHNIISEEWGHYIAKAWNAATSSYDGIANSIMPQSTQTGESHKQVRNADGYDPHVVPYLLTSPGFKAFHFNSPQRNADADMFDWTQLSSVWTTLQDTTDYVPDYRTDDPIIIKKYPIIIPSKYLLDANNNTRYIERINIYIQHKGSFFRYLPLGALKDGYYRTINNSRETNSYFAMNAYGISGLTYLKPASGTSSAFTSNSESQFLPIYSLTTKRTYKIPEVKWDFLNANHILNYWSQMVYYGFSSTLDSTGKYLPTNYIGVSDIEEPTYLPATKLLDVFTKDNAPITTAIPWRDNLVVFTPTTTSMFVGRVPQSQQLINANVGIPDKYRKTAQVVSNSIVFKNEGDVFALVPSAGTDEAESLTVRNISKQISALIKEVETETISNSAGLTALSPSADYHISSMTFNNDEYWLIYGSKKLNKTTIFKYSWSKFCWIMDEYQIYLDDFIKTNEHMIVATDKNGLVYELLSDHKNETASDLASSIDFSKTALTELENLYKTIPNITPQAVELLEAFINLFRYYIGNIDLINSNGTETVSVDFHPIEMLSEDLIKKLRTDIPELVDNEVILQSIELLLNSINNIYGGVPIDFKLVLGARKPMLDTHTMIDELTVAIGTDGKTRSEDQIKATVYTDRLKFTEMNLVSENDSKVISTSVPNVNDLTMSIGNSLYERPAATKKTKKVMKMADAVDVAIEGSVISPVYIDGISISYRQTGRKKF